MCRTNTATPQAELVEILISLMRRLVTANRITTMVDVEQEKALRVTSQDHSGEMSAVTGDPAEVFVNGNIWIAGTFSGGCLKRRLLKTGRG
jgi:hypothetical protein